MGTFDTHADSYQAQVESSIAFANVDHSDVTARKVAHLLSLGTRLLGAPSEQRVLDVGCGIGVTDGLLVDHVGELQGIDISPDSIAQAASANPTVRYTAFTDRFPLADASVDLAFAVCVLHHVPVEERVAFAGELARVVRPGGIVAIFEHNPINPLTRVAVSRCAFDEDAILTTRAQTARLLREAGLIVETGAYIIFTKGPRFSARADRLLGWCPAGAQYYVAARRPTE
jgi:SAM-dependent methyltransferase